MKVEITCPHCSRPIGVTIEGSGGGSGGGPGEIPVGATYRLPSGEWAVRGHGGGAAGPVKPGDGAAQGGPTAPVSQPTP